MLNPTDSRNFHRTFQALALIVGPLLLLAGVLIDAAVFTGDSAAERLPQIRENGGLYLTSSWLFLLAGLVLVPGIVGLIHVLHGARITVGEVGGWLMLLGIILTIGFFVASMFEYTLANSTAVPEGTAVALLNEFDNSPAGFLVFIAFAAGIGLGAILLAIGAWRHGLLPVWAAIALALVGPLAMVPEDWGPVGALSIVLLLIGFGMAGLRMLRMPDTQFEKWEPMPVVSRTATPGPA
ncbi:hypothetical protein ALI22I_14330 [Saccharothrix sp. ALI-22-I]|uniref:DUF4386 family protein n=1 Tax=Saccharothrix sp. ALI-22-I TaxID=1933778 RepID=UPI00097C2DC7|nr:DUF4386 family protein [Saccharothrix sp. ALI-22-I]ONI89676.1 hypothetical protein ALI22I_14330 [Saccharothrix sp. ALI-22-I]